MQHHNKFKRQKAEKKGDGGTTQWLVHMHTASSGCEAYRYFYDFDLVF